MASADGWARTAAALPQGEREARERPFWAALVETDRWRVVADAGCGAGFHLRLLTDLGVRAVGFDLSLAALALGRRRQTLAADLLAPPLAPGRFDAALCLGNTLSLLGNRTRQREALAALAALLRPGGLLLVQAEDAGTLVEGSPLVRSRALEHGRMHLRVFVRHARRVQMLAGVVAPGEDARLDSTWLLPTSATKAAALARPLGLKPVPLPADPPAGAGWWLALRRLDEKTLSVER